MNHLKFAIFLLLVLSIDQLLVGISGNIFISILLPATIFLATKENFPRSIIFAFATGILSDMAALRFVPLLAIFLVLSALLANYLSKKYLEFKSILAIVFTTSVLYIFQILLMSVVYTGSFDLVLLYSFLANSIVGALVVLELFTISKRGLIGE